jgi:hypothetical protein
MRRIFDAFLFAAGTGISPDLVASYAIVERRKWMESMKKLLVAGVFSLTLPISVAAQQRVVVEKRTGNVVDAGDTTLQYDTRYFDHLDLPTNPIPSGEDISKYRRDASGAIVLRPKDELTKGFADEWRNELIARIDRIAISADLKAVLIEIVKGARR